MLTTSLRQSGPDSENRKVGYDAQSAVVLHSSSPISGADMARANISREPSKPPQGASVSQSSAPTFILAKSTCQSSCNCSCHAQTRANKPYLINAVLGFLFAGYHISPWSTDRCDSTYCGNRSMRYTYEYTFPQWFTARTILIAMANSTSRGPEMCLRVMRLVPSTSKIFHAAVSGKIFWVRQLLAQGKASVVDVDEHGHTPLHVRHPIRAIPRSDQSTRWLY